MKNASEKMFRYGNLVNRIYFIISLILVPIITYKTLSWDTVTSFYTSLYELLKEEFLSAYSILMSSVSTGSAVVEFSPDEIVAILDSSLYMMISLVIVAAFAICGLSLKIFSAFVKRLDDDTAFVKSWSFVTPNVYAVFYIILTILNVFFTSGSDVLGITVANLYVIFMFVYAYVGIKLIYGHFAAHHSKFVVSFLIFVILACLPGTAFQIFSVIGVFNTFYHNKPDISHFDGFDSNKK